MPLDKIGATSCAELELSLSRMLALERDVLQRVTNLMTSHLLHEEIRVTRELDYASICIQGQNFS